jgi:hypothetical protein
MNIIQEIHRLQSNDARRIKRLPKAIWKLSDKQTRKSISMNELKNVIESERRGQIEMNSSSDPEVRQALSALEMVWRVANKYEDGY